MKTQKIVTSLLAAVLSIALLAGCGGNADENKDVKGENGANTTQPTQQKEPVTKYTAESGMFAISLPGEWSEDDNMGVPGILSLSGKDSAGILVMGLTKAQLAAAGAEVESLEDFYDFADETMLNGVAASSVLTSTDAVPFPGFVETLAMAGKMTQSDGVSGSIFVQCAESEAAYYFIAFSAASGKYDEMLSSIRNNMSFEELALPESGPLSDTLSWFNGTYAVITTLNGGDLNLVAGYQPGEMIQELMQAMLERDWGVTDRATLDETIDWLLTEGHNADAWSILVGLQDMSREELIEYMEKDGYGENEQIYNLAIYDAMVAYGENAIAGWDLSRAMSLMGWGYLAGYYTYGEAMDKSLETGRKIQQTFDSWDDFFSSYFYGYSYWSEEALDDVTSQAYARRALYEELKSDPAGIFRVDWNTELTKEW